MPFPDDDQANLDEREMPDESDMDQDDDAPTRPCPYCGKFVHEEAQICHHCGNYIVQDDAPRRAPWLLWVVVLVISVVLAVGYCRMKGLLYFGL